MHPMMKPALRRAWRDRQAVQFGVTPAQAVVLDPVDPATGCLLDLLDGTRGLELLRKEAHAMRLPDGQVDKLIARLTRAGLLDDATADAAAAGASRNRNGTPERLRPDLASLSLVHPEPGGGTVRLAARRAVRVQVRGAGRVGATVAALLSASGVGQVEVLDGGCVEPWDIAPGGLPAKAVGERRASAAGQLVRRVAPAPPPRASAATPRSADGGPGLSLVVVAPRDGLDAYVPDSARAADWIATGTPHLYAGVLEGTGMVGPLVLPGGTACPGCLELRRAERDPGWPRMVAQWRSGRRGPVPACDLGLATTVAGLAAAHALTFLDGELPASTGARWETSLPLLDWRSARIAPHPDCPCGAGGHTEGEYASGAGAPHDTMAG
ncbi:TOMM precursor leader peptide-binding protein [Streptomyces sp. NBC_01387]|uniref:TOMM precursor leader peptide-binding protein n=1 Tax=unclassified Streptomyces TaxID=2593676 RepID=UPI0020243FA8|nr:MULTISPECIES: TOMM precursor leader peptide-binding protein [unclassified Streptomyces]MCX4548363.1 TOMM precursor leader peptide-binding protein [Streptomyces sp. NBC_01500]WSV54009.1 TOMM precursor leader peptide-binding protein [Streptomyces sp. NBC_01014]